MGINYKEVRNNRQWKATTGLSQPELFGTRNIRWKTELVCGRQKTEVMKWTFQLL